MRKSVFLVLGVVLVGMNAAQAAGEPSVERNRDREELRVSCRFLGLDAKKGKGTSCEAFARFENHRDREALDRDRDRDDFGRGRLFVSCGGQPIYDDGARFSSAHDGFNFITGFQGNPVIKFVSHHHDHMSINNDRDRDRDNQVVRSWLKVGETVVEGFCALEEEKDKDHGPR